MDHDQYFKVLLKAFFREFFALFFPLWAARFDFDQVEWLDKEIFIDPPEGERRYLDLVAKLRLLQPMSGQRPGMPDATIALLHVEIESGETVAPFRPRMHGYYEHLRFEYRLPVLPIGLFLRVGLNGVGWDVYEEYFWEHRLLHFEYAYVGLPALDGEAYLNRNNLLGVVLAALMRIPEERKAELLAEALKRVAESKENDYRRGLLLTFLEAYWPLTQVQQQQLETLMQTEKYGVMRPLRLSSYEKGLLEGARKDRCEVLQMQIESRFGPLSPQLRERIESLPAERLRELLLALVKAQCLDELGLEK